MDIEEIANAAQQMLDAVEPVTAAAYEALFFLSDDGKRASFLNNRSMEMPGLTQFDRALEMLDTGFDKAFESVRDVPMSLRTCRDQTKEQVEAFHAALTDRGRHTDGGTDYLSKLASMAQSKLRPEVNSFVSEVTRFTDSCKSEDVNRHRLVVDEAINDIETINSTINLIAVNASIEAALAGQAGRGFAIIAEEIQTLSQRSKRIVDEIRTSLR